MMNISRRLVLPREQYLSGIDVAKPAVIDYNNGRVPVMLIPKDGGINHAFPYFSKSKLPYKDVKAVRSASVISVEDKNIIEDRIIDKVDEIDAKFLSDISSNINDIGAATILISSIQGMDKCIRDINEIISSYKETNIAYWLEKKLQIAIDSDKEVPELYMFVEFVALKYVTPIVDKKRDKGVGVRLGFIGVDQDERNLLNRYDTLTSIHNMQVLCNCSKVNIGVVDGKRIIEISSFSPEYINVFSKSIRTAEKCIKSLESKPLPKEPAKPVQKTVQKRLEARYAPKVDFQAWIEGPGWDTLHDQTTYYTYSTNNSTYGRY